MKRQRAWWIAKQNLKGSKKGFVLSVFFNLYFSFFTGVALRKLMEPSLTDMDWSDRLLPDVFMLTCVSVMGFMMTKEYRTYWTSDTFSKRLLFLRTLPIRVEELVLGRFQTMFVSIVSGAIFFFVPLYFIGDIGDRLSVLEYLEWVVLWLSFGIVMGGLYVYAELGGSGRKYLLVSCIGGLGTIALAVLAAFSGFSFIDGTMEWVERYGWLPALGSLLLALLATAGWMRLTERRIRTRDYTR